MGALADFEDDEGKERFARQMMNVWRVTSGAFFLALFCLMWALVFMGWGCGFADEAHIPAVVGSVGLGILLFGNFSRSFARRSLDDSGLLCVAPCWRGVAGMILGDRSYVFATGMPETDRDEDPGLEGAYKPLLTSANAVAFPSTISAGFGTP
jgi:hypothetical protein